MRIPVKNAGRMHTATALLGLALTLTASDLTCASTQNSLFRGNQQRTGRSNYAATYKPDSTWTFRTGTTSSTSPVTGRDGAVYFASYDKYIYCVTNRGALNWRKKTSSVAGSSVAIDNSGNIYVGTVGGSMYAIEPGGSDLWPLPFSGGMGAIEGSALIGNQGEIYFGTDNNWVCALDRSGTLSWRVQVGGAVTQALSASPDGSVIYAPSADGKLYAFNSDGSLRWARDSIAPTSNCAVADNGTIYAGSSDGALYAIGADGGILWKYQTMGRITTAPAIAADGTVYFGSQDSNLYAIDPNGKLKWYHRSYTAIYSSPVIDYFGTIIYGSWDGKLIALNPDNGSTSWSRTVASKLYASPTIGPDGNVYVTDSQGTLIGVSGPAHLTPEPSSLLALAGAITAMATAAIRRRS